MKTHDTARVTLTTVATFPEHYFLENLAVRRDGSILVTALNKKELWLVPAPKGDVPVTPVLVCSLDHLPMGIVEVESDVFYVPTLGDATLERFDMRDWESGTSVKRKRVLTFEQPGAGLNGCCQIAPQVLLIADCAAGLIWRVDLSEDGLTATPSVWLQHDTMSAGGAELPQIVLTPTVTIPYPGVNGVRFAPQGNFLYYTCSAGQLFVRVAVDPATHAPVGEPEIVARNIGAVDDFCIDEDAGVAYITTHIDNTMHRLPLDPATPAAVNSVLAGDPFTDQLVGPSSIVWARGPTDYGSVAYVSTDGGHAKPPPDGVIRPAVLKRLDINV